MEAVKYENVSILFSGIRDFNTFCTHVPPMHIVNLLNEMYTKFDSLADPRIYNVYKVCNSSSYSDSSQIIMNYEQ